MFSYYFKLGVRSLRRNPALTTLTILDMMSGDPIPQKSDRLFVPIFDVAPVDNYNPAEKLRENQVTYPDVMNLLKSGQGVRRTGLYGISAAIEPPRKDLPAFSAQGVAPTR